jgi:hypothetical protein
MDEHPITPPPELVQEWVAEIWHEGTPVRVALSDEHIAHRAAQWGADQELEACCKWLAARDLRSQSVAPCLLRIARRPKPPSLKEQALKALDAVDSFGNEGDRDTIRRALEALPE